MHKPTPHTNRKFQHISTLLIAVLLIGMAALAQPAHAITNVCDNDNKVTGTGVTSYLGGNVGDYILVNNFVSNGHEVNVYHHLVHEIGKGLWDYEEIWQVSGCGGPFANDGRENGYDADQTVAVYCTDEGGVVLYVPGDPLWVIGLTVSADEIAAVPEHPEHNMLIKEKNHVRLYRLTTGELQVNSPGLDPAKGDYVFRFDGCPTE